MEGGKVFRELVPLPLDVVPTIDAVLLARTSGEGQLDPQRDASLSEL